MSVSHFYQKFESLTAYLRPNGKFCLSVNYKLSTATPGELATSYPIYQLVFFLYHEGVPYPSKFDVITDNKIISELMTVPDWHCVIIGSSL